MAGKRIGKEKSRKAGTFLCAKKNLKKKRKKSPYHTYQDGGYPLYSSSSTDGKIAPCFRDKNLLFCFCGDFINNLFFSRIGHRGDSNL